MKFGWAWLGLGLGWAGSGLARLILLGCAGWAGLGLGLGWAKESSKQMKMQFEADLIILFLRVEGLGF